LFYIQFKGLLEANSDPNKPTNNTLLKNSKTPADGYDGVKQLFYVRGYVTYVYVCIYIQKICLQYCTRCL